MPLNNEPVIRKSVLTDLPGILEIYNDAILNTTALYRYEPMTLQMVEQWFDDKTAKGLPIFIADVGGRVAGFASYGSFRPWPAYKYTVEHSIYVHKDCRGKGLAKKLLGTLIDHAAADNLHTIVAGIDSENHVSIGLHRRFGFREVGQVSQVGYKFGRWLDLVFMQLILENNLQPNEK
jgi:L-amino acid N-acyltransferase YncA